MRDMFFKTKMNYYDTFLFIDCKYNTYITL